MSVVLHEEKAALDLYADAWRAAGRPGSPFIVDVGANVGEWALEARRRFPHAMIVCFEPQAGAYTALVRRALSDLNLRVVPLGLSSQPGEATLHASHHDDSVLATLHERPDADSYHGTGLALNRNETVLLTTLDRFAADEELPPIDFLKLDVEGHEHAVLCGAMRLIHDECIGVIQFEWNDCAMHAGISWRHMLDALAGRYSIYREDVTGIRRIIRFDDEEPTADTRNYLAVHDAIDWFPRGSRA